MNTYKNILYIAYFYPPVSGTGLPAINRVRKFVKYIPSTKSVVLTVDQTYYPKHVKLDDQYANFYDESVYRTRMWSPFSFLFTIKNFLRRNNNNVQELNAVKKEEKSEEKTASTTLSKKFIEAASSLMIYPDSEHSWLLPAIWKGVRIVKKERINIILATGFPWTSLMVGAFISKLTGVQLVTDFRDPWVNNPYLTRGELMDNLDKRAERFVVNNSDLVLLNTENLLEEFRKRYPGSTDKLKCVTNGFDPDDFRDLPVKELPQNQLNLTHAGSLYLKRDPESILLALASLCQYEEVNIVFNQIGAIRLDYDFDSRCMELGIAQKIKKMEYMPYIDCLGYMKVSDVLVLIQPDTKTQIPSKLYEYIYFNKPILAVAEEDGALGQMVRDYDFGQVFPPEDINGIKEYLKYLMDSKNQGGLNEFTYQKADFNARIISQELAQSIERIPSLEFPVNSHSFI